MGKKIFLFVFSGGQLSFVDLGGRMEDEKKFNPEETINLQWCTDSETGEQVLVDKINHKIIGRRIKNDNCPLCGK